MSRMSRAEEEIVVEIANEIERYLRAHPDAADTAAGIQRWWLSERHDGESTAQVCDALASLAERGLVAPVRLPDGRLLYVATRIVD